jgi:DNA polymerase-3 subunit delta
MQVSPEQLESRLGGALAPVYFISGDEPLRVMEAADAVRARATAEGFAEREVLTVSAGFDWSSLTEAAGSLSLFASRRVLDLRLPGGKPGEAGAKALRAYAGAPPADTLLLITAGKLEPSARKSRWVQALDRVGVVVFVWPLNSRQLPGWVNARLHRRGLEATPQAAALLAERVEGNLLACVQEIEKLYLLLGPGRVDVPAIASAVADSARFEVYDLVDAALAGEGARGVRILNGLRAEGVASAVVLWALARDIRQLAAMARVLAGGQGVAQVLARFRVWQSRTTVFSRALERHSAIACGRLLRRCARVDRVIKGQAAGNAWDELLQLILWLGGVNAVPAAVKSVERG